MAEFRMPSLGADMEAGTLVEWLIHVGDSVHRGDIIAVVETQKGAIEVECFDTGTVIALKVQPGEKVPVGTVLALIGPMEASVGPAQTTAVAPPGSAVLPPPPPASPAAAAPASSPALQATPTPVAHPSPVAPSPPETPPRTPELSPAAAAPPSSPALQATPTPAAHPSPVAPSSPETPPRTPEPSPADAAPPSSSALQATPTPAAHPSPVAPSSPALQASPTPAAHPSPVAPSSPEAPPSPRSLGPEASLLASSPAAFPAPEAHPWPVEHDWIRSSPAARRRAQELGVDLATVKGRGPHGAITREDVEQHAAPPVTAPRAPVDTPTAPPTPVVTPPAPKATPAQAMRAAIAAAMAKSNREIPHYYLGQPIDLFHALGVLSRFNEGRPIEERVLPAALLIHAVAKNLARFPDLNGAWTGDGYVPASAIHVGVAVSLKGGGLVVPCLHHTDTLDLVGIMAGLRDLVARARAGKLRASDLSDGTVTLTNLGDQGAESVFGVIYPGQSALIGFGKVIERPWAVNGMLAIRPIVHASLAGDHRASDGHRGAQFLAAVDRTLQEFEIP